MRRYRLATIGIMAVLITVSVVGVVLAKESDPRVAVHPGPDERMSSYLATPVAVPADLPRPLHPLDHITIAVENVAPSTGLGSAQLDISIHYYGIGETTFQATVGDSAAPMLATGWTLEPDLSGGSMTIRDDVVFHGEGLRWAGGVSWGPMTAADIAYTINDGNNAINAGSIHWNGGDFAALFGANPLVATDDTTIEFTFAAFDVRWNSGNALNDAGQSFSVQSTAVRDAMGEQWMRNNPLISTGPLQIRRWLQDDRLVAEAVPYAHWSGNDAQFGRITWLEVTDESARTAMLRTGTVDAAKLSLEDTSRLLNRGFASTDNGLKNLVSVIFSGNLWETNHAITGDPLDTAAVYMRDVEWVGNPNDPVDFEEATLVRNALARAYDREHINETTQAGLGFPAYLNQFSPTSPHWQRKWEYPFDPVEAGNLLDQAGWPLVDGVRFEMPLYVTSGGDDQEIAHAVAAYWSEIGVKTSVPKFRYSVYRPSIVARATTLAWVTPCDDGNSNLPWDWPKSMDHTSINRGGFGCGIEIPEVAEAWLAAAAEPDEATRIAINNGVADYLFEQAVSPGIVGQPHPITYNPNRIAAWPMSPGLFESVNDYEAIVPAP